MATKCITFCWVRKSSSLNHWQIWIKRRMNSLLLAFRSTSQAATARPSALLLWWINSMQTTLSFPSCPANLSNEQIEQYRREGFLAFTDVLSASEVEETRAAISELVQRVAGCENPEKKGP